MKGIHWTGLLAGIVIVLVIVGISLIMVMPLGEFDVKKYFGLQPTLGVPADITTSYFVTDVELGSTPESPHIVTGDSDEFWQPSDLGCAIADVIFNDFRTKGNDGSRATGSNCFINRGNAEHCIVAIGTFKLNETMDDPGDWETTLSARGCHFCGPSTNPEYNSSVFDEICINYNLKDRTVGVPGDFCHDQFSAGPSNQPTRFGNAECYCGNYGDDCGNDDDWRNNCDGHYGTFWDCLLGCWKEKDNDGDDFCDNNEHKLIWLADDSEGDPKSKVRDHDSLWYDEDDAHVGAWGKIELYTKYMWGLVWRADTQKYILQFVRIPHHSTDNSFNFIVEVLKSKILGGDPLRRFNLLGVQSQYARMIMNVTVVLDSSSDPDGWTQKTEFDLREEIKAATGANVVADFVSCTDESRCLASEKGPTNSGERECDESSQYLSISADSKFDKQNILFKTNMAENEKFTDGTYKVVIENWYNKYQVCEGWPWCTVKNCFDTIDRTISIWKVS